LGLAPGLCPILWDLTVLSIYYSWIIWDRITVSQRGKCRGENRERKEKEEGRGAEVIIFKYSK